MMLLRALALASSLVGGRGAAVAWRPFPAVRAAAEAEAGEGPGRPGVASPSVRWRRSAAAAGGDEGPRRVGASVGADVDAKRFLVRCDASRPDEPCKPVPVAAVADGGAPGEITYAKLKHERASKLGLESLNAPMPGDATQHHRDIAWAGFGAHHRSLNNAPMPDKAAEHHRDIAWTGFGARPSRRARNAKERVVGVRGRERRERDRGIGKRGRRHLSKNDPFRLFAKAAKSKTMKFDAVFGDFFNINHDAPTTATVAKASKTPKADKAETATITMNNDVWIESVGSSTTGAGSANDHLSPGGSNAEALQDALAVEGDSAEGYMNEELSIPILLNDVIPGDIDGDIIKHPEHGVLKRPAEDGVVYSPESDWCGHDSFEYEMRFGASSASATVNIHILCRENSASTVTDPTEGAPESAPLNQHASDLTSELNLEDDFAEGNTNEELSIPILLNDVIPEDVNGDLIKQPEHGTIVRPTADGLVYMPERDWCGQDSFEYEMRTGEMSASATVNVHILCSNNVASTNTDPAKDATPAIASPSESPTKKVSLNQQTSGSGNVVLKVEDDYAEGNMNEGLSIPILANDIIPADGDGDIIQFPQHGEIEWATVDGFLYQPEKDWCGHDSFVYEMTSGELSDSATATIHILCDQNSASTVTDATQAPETMFPTRSPTDRPSKTPTDRPSLNEQASNSGNGESTTSSTAANSVVVTTVDDFAEGQMNEQLSIPILANDDIPKFADGDVIELPKHGEILMPTKDGLVYNPDRDWCGNDSFVYKVSSGELSDIATVTVHVACDSDIATTEAPPPVTDATKVVTPASIATVATVANFASPSRPPTEEPTQSPTTAAPIKAPSISPTQSPSLSPTYYPTADVLPIANDDFATTPMGTPVMVYLLDNDIIPPDVTSGSFTDPEHGSMEVVGNYEFVYTPNDDFCGMDQFTYTVSNPRVSSTANVRIEVTCDTSEESEPTIQTKPSEVNNADVDSQDESAPTIQTNQSEANNTYDESSDALVESSKTLVNETPPSKVAVGFAGALGASLAVALIVVFMRNRGKPAEEQVPAFLTILSDKTRNVYPSNLFKGEGPLGGPKIRKPSSFGPNPGEMVSMLSNSSLFSMKSSVSSRPQAAEPIEDIVEL